MILDCNDNTVGTVAADFGSVSVVNGLPLGKYKLIQYEAPADLYPCRNAYYFELEHPCCTRIINVPAGMCYDDCLECRDWNINSANVAIKIKHDCGHSD